MTELSAADEAVLDEVKKVFMDELIEAMGKMQAAQFAGIFFELPMMHIEPHETVAHIIARRLREVKA